MVGQKRITTADRVRKRKEQERMTINIEYETDKTDITGISNEPWHYRYVGTTVAKIMKEENLCLEEYLEKYK